MATSGGIRLYTLDGGRLHVTGVDATELADDGAYEGRTFDMPVPCFLIRHPGGDLMWDTGMSRSRTDLGDWATPGASLVDQLRALELAPADIRFLSVSHGHWDHSGNAGLFAGSTWIVNPDERAFMFDDEIRASPSMDDYGALEGADALLISDDHDVFGDGSVVIIQSPGHPRATPSYWCGWPKLGRSCCPATCGTRLRADAAGGCPSTTRVARRRWHRWIGWRRSWPRRGHASSSSMSLRITSPCRASRQAYDSQISIYVAREFPEKPAPGDAATTADPG